ncbi:sorting nexin-16-like isoform X2 [Engraulis encrasicolus]
MTSAHMPGGTPDVPAEWIGESLPGSPEFPRTPGLWVRGGGFSCLPSASCQLPGSAGPGTQRGFDRMTSGVFSNMEGCSVQDDWDDDDRPPTPTLMGYEVMEERSKFTVYKILVRRTEEESWVVFRRYTDFSRLNDKLKELFPRFKLSLPPKRWFRDNYDMAFLEERQQGLRSFLQTLVTHRDLTNSEAVRGFLCLNNPPGAADSLDKNQKSLEETNLRLQRLLIEKDQELESLKKCLESRDLKISLLEKQIGTHVAEGTDRVFKPLIFTTHLDSEEEEDEEEENDSRHRLPPTTNSLQKHVLSCEIQVPWKGHGACWCGPARAKPRGHF